MENVAIKGRGGNDVRHKNWKRKILRIWITIIRHGGLGVRTRGLEQAMNSCLPKK